MKLTFHGLRHTAATLMLQGIPEGLPGFKPIAGLSPHVVAEILGHSSTALLWRTYAHVILPAQGTHARLTDAHLSQFDNTRPSPVPEGIPRAIGTHSRRNASRST